MARLLRGVDAESSGGTVENGPTRSQSGDRDTTLRHGSNHREPPMPDLPSWAEARLRLDSAAWQAPVLSTALSRRRSALGGRVIVPEQTLAAMDEATEALLRDLRGSPTDLAKLVKRVHERRRPVVAISPKAIARWNKDDPDSWGRVCEWLTRQGVRIWSAEGVRV